MQQPQRFANVGKNQLIEIKEFAREYRENWTWKAVPVWRSAVRR